MPGHLEDGQTYDSFILSSDSSDSLNRFISASLAVSSISLLDVSDQSRIRLLAFTIHSTKSDESSDILVFESVWDEGGETAFLVLSGLPGLLRQMINFARQTNKFSL